MRYIVNIISNCLIVRNNKIGRWISNVFLEPLKLYSIELDEVCEKHKTLISLSLAFRATPCLGLLSRFFFSLSSPSLWAKVYLLNSRTTSSATEDPPLCNKIFEVCAGHTLLFLPTLNCQATHFGSLHSHFNVVICLLFYFFICRNIWQPKC